MEERRFFTNNVANLAMTYGTVMGLFWILKFLLIPFIFTVPFASLLFVILTLSVPFVGYFMARQYRNRYCPDGVVSFIQAWVFTLLLYVYAALLVAVVHYLFFQYFNDGTLVATYNGLLDEMVKASPELAPTVAEYHKAMEQVTSLSPIELTLQLLLNNIFYGMMFALPTAFLLAFRRKKADYVN